MDDIPEAALLDLVSALVVVIDRDGRIVRWNSACTQASGYSFEEVRGKHVWDMSRSPGEVALVREVFADLDAGRVPRQYENQVVGKDGTHRWIAWTNSASFGPDGRVAFVVATGADISERKRTEEALEHSQKSMARAQTIGRVGNWERDIITNQIYWSDELYRLVGMSPGEPLDGFEDFLKLVHPEDRERVTKAAGDAVRAGMPYSADFRLVRRDGTVLLVHANAELVEDEHGQRRRLVGTARDITERGLAEATVKASEERIRLLLESSAEGIFGVDLKGDCSFANHAFAEMLGYAGPDSLLGRNLHALMHHSRADGSPFPPEECPGLKALRSASALQVEDDVFWKADGTRVRVEYRVRPILQGGKLTGIVTTVRDIGEKKRAEEAEHFLSEASKALASSLDYSATLAQVAQLAVPRLADWCLILVLGEDGTLRPIKVAHADLAKSELARDIERGFPPPPGAASARVLGTGQPELTRDVRDEDLVATAVDAAHLEAMRRIGIRSRIAVPLAAEGKNFGAVILVAAESGRRYGPNDLALAEEVGRRAALAIANARLYQTAQRAVQAREDLLAIVSHDLRTPLSVIVLQATALQRLFLTAEQTSALKKLASIRSSAAQIKLLITDLLDAATIEAGRLAIVRQRHEIRSMVDDAIEGTQPLAEQGSLKVERQDLKGLPLVACDRRRILRVLTNLLSNAIKFTPSGGTIQVRAERCDGAVRFTVADTGSGISPDAVPHLFERYWQADRAKRAGAGLGLFIAKGIVEAHGGRIWAESKLGEGSSFYFTLPVEPPSEARSTR